MRNYNKSAMTKFNEVLLWILAVVAWVLAFFAWWKVPSQLPRPTTWAISTALVIVGLSLVPPITRALRSTGLRWRHFSHRHPVIAAVLAGLGGGGALLGIALIQGRSFHLSWHDEFAYVIHARIMAEGRLWMPGHPLGDSIASFYMFAEPVFAAMYFPGTSMLYALGLAFALPVVWISLTISAGVCGVFYALVSRLVNPVWGLSAVALLVGTGQFRLMSTKAMSHPVFMLLIGICLLSVLVWRTRPTVGAAACMGAAGGWALVTRPVDAMCFGILILIAIIANRRVSWKSRARTLAVATLLALPFIAAQAAINHAVTGKFTGFPHARWVEENVPGAGLSAEAFGQPVEVRSIQPQIRKLYHQWYKPAIAYHQQASFFDKLVDRQIPRELNVWFVHLLLIGVAVPGLRKLSRDGRWIVVLPLFLFTVFYSFWTFMQGYYPLSVLPGALVLIALGGRWWSARPPHRRPRMLLRTVLPWWIALVGVMATPLARPGVIDERIDGEIFATVDDQLDNLPYQPAIVFFYFDNTSNPHIEHVYNPEVAWPDDARVVRLHELGAANNQAIEYYARIQPQRHVYLFHRLTGEVRYLGRVDELAASIQQKPNAPTPEPKK